MSRSTGRPTGAIPPDVAAAVPGVVAAVPGVVAAGPDAPAPDGAAHAVEHVDALTAALGALRADGGVLTRWGQVLHRRLSAGHRLLAAGNGGSAAEAQHLTAELVGRYCEDRPPFSAIALHAETSSLTAIANDYGWEAVYARQVTAHGRPGDVLILLSTSGVSPNVLAAAEAGRRAGLLTWALTGPRPNPLAYAVDQAVCVPAATTATVQEAHLVAVHMICGAFEGALRARAGRSGEMSRPERAVELPA